MSTRFRYQLLRYADNLTRGEFVNFGIVLQTDDNIAVRFKEIKTSDKEAFSVWKDFIQREIDTQDHQVVLMFRPPRCTKKFLIHLQKLNQGNFNATKPCVLEYRQDKTFDEVMEEMYGKFIQ